MLYADQVFHRGRIVTLAPRPPQAQALAVVGGRVAAVGTDEEITGLIGPRTTVIDLDGCTVLPGFHDAHCHVLLFGLSLVEVNVRDAQSVRDVVDAVGQRARRVGPGEWIRGGGYNQTRLAERRHPTRADLDTVSPHNPVWLAHISGHMGVANSLALAMAGIGRDTPDPAGGRIERDERGEPTGLLLETAQDLVKRILPSYSLTETKAALAAAGRQMAAEGVTAAQDAWAGWIAPEEFRAYQEAVEDGLLPQRVWLMVDVERLTVQGERFQFAFGLRSGFGSDRLRLGAIKIFTDGSLIGRTAALTRPYARPTGTMGLLVKSEAAIHAQVRTAHLGGWQVALHAIGDRAIEVSLDAIEAAMAPDPTPYRPRIEHCGVLRADLIERIRRTGVVVVTQPRFIFELGDGFAEALGEERLRLTYPLASLRGIPMAFSSDRPVVDGAPLRGIAAAVLQRTASGRPYVPEEALDVADAVRAYTLGAAYSVFAERALGSLEVGKYADFVALATDPYRISPEEIERIPVVMTVVGGEVVHRL